MEISSSMALLSPSSLPKPLPSLPFSSRSSAFFQNPHTSLFNVKAQRFTSLLLTSPARTAKRNLSVNSLFGLGVPELAVIAGVAALVFGPKKLPEVGRSIGKTVKSFQQAAKEFETELKKEPESATEPPIGKPMAVDEEEEREAKVTNTKESV